VPKIVDIAMTVFCKIFRIPNYFRSFKTGQTVLFGFLCRSDFLWGEGILMKMAVRAKEVLKIYSRFFRIRKFEFIYHINILNIYLLTPLLYIIVMEVNIE